MLHIRPYMCEWAVYLTIDSTHAERLYVGTREECYRFADEYTK